MRLLKWWRVRKPAKSLHEAEILLLVEQNAESPSV